MVRDLKHRYVDGLILVSLHLTDAHADELRRAAAPVIVIGRPTKGTPRRLGPRVLAQGRRRSGPAPARGGPAADRVRQRPSAHRAGIVASPRLSRRPALVRPRARRRADRGRRRLHDRAGPRARPSACSSGRGPTRSSAPTTCSRSARSRRCAMPGSTFPATSRWSGMDNTPLAEVTWPTLTSVDLGSAERARIAAELLLERIEGLTARAAHARRRAAPRRPRLVGSCRHEQPSPRRGRPAAARPQPGRRGPLRAGRRCCC